MVSRTKYATIRIRYGKEAKFSSFADWLDQSPLGTKVVAIDGLKYSKA